ncbi:IS66 family insertion sequence element accessory protein TnpB [Mesorhizobium sp. M1374]|uniref:IS66 family insertion sequence element accessory protein TnpB n=1 Tax=Mesorhizobium sp. M1374 TaxID=2957091 RepID=UPI0033386849
MIKIIWHDGLGMSLYAKRLEKGRFLWPSPTDGTVSISPAACLHARRDRLAQPASHVPPPARGLSFSLSLRHFPRVSGRVL